MTLARRSLSVLGAPVRMVLIGAIRLYRIVLSGWLGGQCRFSPTCSHYAEQAIRTHGALRGSALAVGRILRCNPFGRGGLDPVPLRPASYDIAIHPASSDVSELHAG
jgi:putative membrane protein insertion efficiency factor